MITPNFLYDEIYQYSIKDSQYVNLHVYTYV